MADLMPLLRQAQKPWWQQAVEAPPSGKSYWDVHGAQSVPTQDPLAQPEPRLGISQVKPTALPPASDLVRQFGPSAALSRQSELPPFVSRDAVTPPAKPNLLEQAGTIRGQWLIDRAKSDAINGGSSDAMEQAAKAYADRFGRADPAQAVKLADSYRRLRWAFKAADFLTADDADAMRRGWGLAQQGMTRDPQLRDLVVSAVAELAAEKQLRQQRGGASYVASGAKRGMGSTSVNYIESLQRAVGVEDPGALDFARQVASARDAGDPGDKGRWTLTRWAAQATEMAPAMGIGVAMGAAGGAQGAAQAGAFWSMQEFPSLHDEMKAAGMSGPRAAALAGVASLAIGAVETVNMNPFGGEAVGAAVKQRFRQVLLGTLKSYGKEVGEEGVQGGIRQAAMEAAKIAGGDPKAAGNSSQVLDRVVSQAATDAIEAAGPLLVMGAAGRAVREAGERIVGEMPRRVTVDDLLTDDAAFQGWATANPSAAGELAAKESPTRGDIEKNKLPSSGTTAATRAALAAKLAATIKLSQPPTDVGQTDPTPPPLPTPGSESPHAPIANGIPTQLTHALRKRLYDLGYSETDIAGMTPADAHAIAQSGRSKVATPVADASPQAPPPQQVTSPEVTSRPTADIPSVSQAAPPRIEPESPAPQPAAPVASPAPAAAQGNAERVTWLDAFGKRRFGTLTSRGGSTAVVRDDAGKEQRVKDARGQKLELEADYLGRLPKFEVGETATMPEFPGGDNTARIAKKNPDGTYDVTVGSGAVQRPVPNVSPERLTKLPAPTPATLPAPAAPTEAAGEQPSGKPLTAAERMRVHEIEKGYNRIIENKLRKGYRARDNQDLIGRRESDVAYQQLKAAAQTERRSQLGKEAAANREANESQRQAAREQAVTDAQQDKLSKDTVKYAPLHELPAELRTRIQQTAQELLKHAKADKTRAALEKIVRDAGSDTGTAVEEQKERIVEGLTGKRDLRSPKERFTEPPWPNDPIVEALIQEPAERNERIDAAVASIRRLKPDDLARHATEHLRASQPQPEHEGDPFDAPEAKVSIADVIDYLNGLRHDADRHGEAQADQSGAATESDDQGDASFDPESFALENETPQPKGETFENQAGDQRKLFSGMNALPGQQDLFDDLNKPGDGTAQLFADERHGGYAAVEEFRLYNLKTKKSGRLAGATAGVAGEQVATTVSASVEPSTVSIGQLIAAVKELHPEDVPSAPSGSGSGGGSSHASKPPKGQPPIPPPLPSTRPAPAAGQLARPPQQPPPLLHAIQSPELFQLATELMSGRTPAVKKLRGPWGVFQASEGIPESTRIYIDPTTAATPEQLSRTLAHEIGHLADFLPDATMKRGNLVGRVATLRRFLKGTMGGLVNKELRAELIALSEWWKPYDKAQASGEYVKYRESSVELYADALSVLLNAPAEIQARAPKFWQAFSQLINRKPEFLDAYLSLQDILNGASGELADMRRQRVQEMFLHGDEKFAAIQAERHAVRDSLWQRFLQLLNSLNQYFVSKSAPVVSRQRRVEQQHGRLPAGWNPEFALDELAYAENDVTKMLREAQRHVNEPLLKRGLTTDAISEYLFFRRITNERGDIANPLAHTPAEAQAMLDDLAQRLGPTDFAELERLVKVWHDQMFEIARLAADEGVYSQEKFKGTIEPNRDNYAAFIVLKHLNSDKVPAAIRQQVGTFEEVLRPFDGTMLKMATVLRLVNYNRAKRTVRDFLQRHYPSEIEAVQVNQVPDQPRRDPPRAPEGKDYLVVLEDGKPAWWLVDQHVANVFAANDAGGLSRFGRMLESAEYKIFHPLYVTLSLGFASANPIRDTWRTWRNLGAAQSARRRELMERLIAGGMSKGDARKATAAQKVTLGQVWWAYLRAVPAGVRRARGIEDADVERMLDEKSLGTPFVELIENADATNFSGKTPFERLLAAHGLVNGPPASGNMATRFVRGLHDVMAAVGTMQETAGKVSADRLLEARGVTGPEKSFLIREYAGTPNLNRRGLGTSVTNSLFMYSKIWAAGWLAESRLAADPRTRSAYFARHIQSVIVPKTIIRFAKLGLFGGAVKAMYEALPAYMLTNYLTLPLGWLFQGDDDEEEPQVVAMTVPMDETARMAGHLWDGVLDAALAAAGIVDDSPSEETSKAFNRILGDSPSINPLLGIGAAWTQFAAGRNPYDDFRNAPVVPRDEWEAGGWDATRKMLAWTIDEFGVLGAVAHSFVGPYLGEATRSGTETTREATLKGTLRASGIGRWLRVTNAGIDEQEWAKIENDDAEKARFRLSLPAAAKRLNTEQFRLSRLRGLGVELSEENEVRRLILDDWRYQVYDLLRDEIERDEAAGGDGATGRAQMKAAAERYASMKPHEIPAEARARMTKPIMDKLRSKPPREKHKEDATYAETMASYRRERQEAARLLGLLKKFAAAPEPAASR